MAEKWFISDTHFFHENIIRYCGRPFANAEMMNVYMIVEWNKLVQPQDKVYHLGDVGIGFGGDDTKLGNLLGQLNGKKRLILGNHDNAKSVALQKHFDKIELWYGRKEWSFTASHMPLKEGHFRDGSVNVHGHTHNTWVDGPYINVCVENTMYRPIHIEEIFKEVKKLNEKYPNPDKGRK